MAEPREKPLLIFDGDCSFCRAWIARWDRWTAGRVEYAPFQEVAGQFPEISISDFEKAVHLVDRQGRVTRAAQAVFLTLSESPRLRFLIWAYRKIPGFAWISERAYAVVAGHRVLFSWLTYLLSDPELRWPRRGLAALAAGVAAYFRLKAS